MQEESQEYLTAQEVADELRVPVSTVWRWTRAGRLEATKLSRQTKRYTRRQVDEFIRRAAA